MSQNLSEDFRRHLFFCALNRNAVIDISYTSDALCQNGDLKRWPKMDKRTIFILTNYVSKRIKAVPKIVWTNSVCKYIFKIYAEKV